MQRSGTPIAVVLLAFCAAAHGQTHKVAKPENVVRAVGVYEWTGDMAKPTASRLIPVTLFIDGKLEDAGVYLARPVPLSLLTGNLYEIDQSGVPKGTLDLLFARHLVATDAAATDYDDGWFGYGKFMPPAPPPKVNLAAVRPARTSGIVSSADDDDSKPHFSSRSATPGSGGSAEGVPQPTASTTPAADPDRPTFHKPNADSTSTQTASTDPPADPDRPTLHKPSSSPESADAPPDDADRPTLRRRAPEDPKKAKNTASVTDAGSLNDDPNRPTLHRGKPAAEPTLEDFPKLSGLPGDEDLHQMVAVSDPANRPVHDFARPWEGEDERQAILAEMQGLARTQLTAYEAAYAVAPAKPATPAPATKPATQAHRKAATPPPAPPPEPLLDEQLHGYTLSYGGQPTYVYTAHTDGLGVEQRFVILVAQVDMQGKPELAFKSVTDAAHLDRTPRYRLVDAVDAEASNRASLLFELREKNSRQFALYRVIGARAEQTFLTGTTQ